MHISQQKQRLRAYMNERISHLPDRSRLAESRSLCRRLLPSIPKGSFVAAYFPLKNEADLRPLLLTLLKRGDTVFLPRFSEKKHMEFRQIFELTNLPAGSFAVPEPDLSAPLLDASKLSVALIPGRAFDLLGGRLGRGNGGFDRWIREMRSVNDHALFVGCALECQVVEEVPMEEHDERLDAIVTAQGMVDCHMDLSASREER